MFVFVVWYKLEAFKPFEFQFDIQQKPQFIFVMTLKIISTYGSLDHTNY